MASLMYSSSSYPFKLRKLAQTPPRIFYLPYLRLPSKRIFMRESIQEMAHQLIFNVYHTLTVSYR